MLRGMDSALSLEVSPLLILLFIALLSVVALALWVGLTLGRRAGRMEAERGLPRRLAAEREDALKRSRAVLGGLAGEQLAPFLPGFPADPTESRFIGKPVDFIAFSGASRGVVDEVVFIEVKSGGAQASKIERSLRDAVKAGRVRWVDYRIPDSDAARRGE
jgi:predicted Holliday junction resolvase-like endonuclease